MVVLETLFLGNDSGSLVNAAQSLPAWRRLVSGALGGLTAGGPYSGSGSGSVAPHAATDYMEALETGDGCFDTPASLVKSLASLLVVVTGGAIAGRRHDHCPRWRPRCSPAASRRRVNGNCMGRLRRRRQDGSALSCPLQPAACLSLKFSLAR